MSNEERIRRWREQRLPDLSARLSDDDVAEDAAPAALDRPDAKPRGKAGTAVARPHEITLEEARAAIRYRRREQWRKILRRTGLYVGIPLLAVLAYIALIATPLYQGEAVFTVQTSADTGSAATAGLFGLGSSTGAVADAL